MTLREFSRRGFLPLGTAAGAAVPTIPQWVHSAGSDILKIGLVGCGGRGTGSLRDSLTVMPNVRVVALGELLRESAVTKRAAITASAIGKGRIDVPEDRIFSGFDSHRGGSRKAISCISPFHPDFIRRSTARRRAERERALSNSRPRRISSERRKAGGLMKSSRRRFIACSSVLPFLGLLPPGYRSPEDFYETMEATTAQYRDRKQVFNMCGYAAPAIPHLRVGYIGLGNRGYASIQRLGRMNAVEIRAICDVYGYPIQRAKDFLKSKGCPEPAVYTGSNEAWKGMCERDDLDLIYVLTPTFYHAEMAVHVLMSGKHAAVEVSAAQRVDDCWRLVDASERTRRHCVLLENCVYDFFESMAINMAHQGALGEIIHAEGAYINPERPLFEEPKPPHSKESAPWYGSVLAMAPGNRIPTHGTAPICQAMKIGRGDRLDYLTSMETDDFIRAKTANDLAASGSVYHQQFKNKRHAGNVNTTMIRTVKGKTLLVEFDAVNPRPYSRIFQLSGSKGFAQKYPLPPRIYPDGERLASEAEMKAFEDKYTPELVRFIEKTAKRFGGHGGMDFTVDWRLVDNLRNGRPMDVDVYDAALWSSITPLTLWSVINRSSPIDVPDFTCGAWSTNPPLSLTLQGGGNTEIRELPG